MRSDSRDVEILLKRWKIRRDIIFQVQKRVTADKRVDKCVVIQSPGFNSSLPFYRFFFKCFSPVRQPFFINSYSNVTQDANRDNFNARCPWNSYKHQHNIGLHVEVFVLLLFQTQFRFRSVKCRNAFHVVNWLRTEVMLSKTKWIRFKMKAKEYINKKENRWIQMKIEDGPFWTCQALPF